MGSEEKLGPIYVPDDIIFNILRKLRGKSLVRFKCVCKKWRSFISNLRYDNQKLILLSSSSVKSVDFQSSTIEAVRLDFPIECSEFCEVIGSCYGLVCIVIKKTIHEKETILWNPFTGGYKGIPIAIEGNNLFGLGYSQSTDDYKIVRVYNSETRFDVYSLNTDSWERGTLPWRISFGKVLGISVNGALHWQSMYRRRTSILRFDLTKQTFGMISLPNDVAIIPESKFDLLDYGGCLCLAHCHKTGVIDLWQMESLEEQNWVQLMTIPRLEDINYCFYYLVPVYIFKDDEVLLNIRYIQSGRRNDYGCCTNRFRSYTPKLKTFEIFKIQGSQELDQLIPYTESPISPVRS